MSDSSPAKSKIVVSRWLVTNVGVRKLCSSPPTKPLRRWRVGRLGRERFLAQRLSS